MLAPTPSRLTAHLLRQDQEPADYQAATRIGCSAPSDTGLDSTWEPTLERTGPGGAPFAGRACKHALTDPMPTHAVGLGQARVEAFR